MITKEILISGAVFFLGIGGLAGLCRLENAAVNRVSVEIEPARVHYRGDAERLTPTITDTTVCVTNGGDARYEGMSFCSSEALLFEVRNRDMLRHAASWNEPGLDLNHSTNLEFVFHAEPTLVAATNGMWVYHFKP